MKKVYKKTCTWLKPGTRKYIQITKAALQATRKNIYFSIDYAPMHEGAEQAQTPKVYIIPKEQFNNKAM